MTQTLLEQALGTKQVKRFPADELLEMALAVIQNDITVADAQRVIYPNKKVSSGYHQLTAARLLRCIQVAVTHGQLRIVKVSERD